MLKGMIACGNNIVSGNGNTGNRCLNWTATDSLIPLDLTTQNAI